MKRSIQILPTGQEFVLSKVVAVDVPKRFVMLEEIKDGTFRLTYTKSLIPDTQDISGAIIVRED